VITLSTSAEQHTSQRTCKLDFDHVDKIPIQKNTPVRTLSLSLSLSQTKMSIQLTFCSLRLQSRKQASLPIYTTDKRTLNTAIQTKNKHDLHMVIHYTPCPGKKSLWFTMHNCNKFRVYFHSFWHKLPR